MIDVTLQVGGTVYRGWKTIEVSIGMEQISGSFKLTVSDRWHGQDQAWPIMRGDACRIAIGGKTVVTGYVDEANPSYDRQSHGLEVTGRDKTADLVDCSAIYKTGQWNGATLFRIATDLCRPFGIPVRAEVDAGKPFSKFALQEGETAFEALDRAARQRGVLALSNGEGGLVLTRAAIARIATALVKGKNIEAASGTFSLKERYSRYIIKGQAPGGDDFSEPAHHAQLRATSEDDSVTRYRPLIVYAEQGDGSTYAERAVWERNVRAGRSSRVQYTVTGWEYGPGAIWIPNRMVRVQDGYIGIDAELLIARCTYLLDEGGSRTCLELCRREAFDLIDLPKRTKDKEPLKW